MTVIGTSYIDVEPRTDGFEKGVLSKVSSVAKLAAGAFAAAFVIKEGISFASGLVKDAEEAQKVSKQTAAAIASTGGAAKVTQQQIADLAGALSRKTGIDDEAIQSGQNLLLTFTKVRNEAGAGNDIFNQATKVLVDMGAAMKTGPTGSAIQLGKALNDPIKGITALTRVGVTFDAAQKKQIENFTKTGQLAKAQGIILAELNKEFGGSAEAQATGSAKLAVAYGNLREDLGAKLLPVVEKVTTFLADKLPGAMDALGPVIDGIGRAIAGVVADLQPSFDSMVAGVKALIEGFQSGQQGTDGFVGAMQTVGAILKEQVLPVVQEVAAFIGDNLQPALLAIGVAFLALTSPITLAVAAFVAAYTQLDGFRKLVDQVAVFLVKTFSDLVAAIRARMGAIQEAIGHVIAAIEAVWAVWGDNLINVAKTVFQTIAGVVQAGVRVVRDVIDVVLAVINGDWGKAWNALKDIPAAVMSAVVALVKGYLRVTGELIAAAMEGLQRVWSAAWSALRGVAEAAFGAVLTFVASIPGRILGALGDLSGLLANVGRDIVMGLLHGISNAWHSVTEKVAELVSKIPGPVRKLLGISSPSKVFFQIGEYTIEGLVQGIQSKQTKAQKAATDLAKKVAQATKDALQAAMSGVGDLFGGLGAINGRQQAQNRVVQNQDALQLAIAQRDALPAKIVAARAALAKVLATSRQVTPEEQRDLASAEDAVTTAVRARTAAQAELDRLTARRATTDQVVAQLQAQESAAKAAKDATDAAAAAAAAPTNEALQRQAVLASAQAVQAQEALVKATDEATTSDQEQSDAARQVYLANLDVTVATDALGKKRAEVTADSADVADAERTLNDLLTEQADAAREVKAATDALNESKLAAIQAELAYVEAQQKLATLAPGTLQFFRDLAEQAGLSDGAIGDLVRTLGLLRGGAGSDVLAPTPTGRLINTVTKRQAYTGPEGEAGSASRAAIEAYARAHGMNPADVRSFTIGGVTSYYLPGQAIDPGNVGALAGLPRYASGGATKPGQWSIAGEHGPELWRQGSAGQFYDAKTTAAALAQAAGQQAPVAMFGPGSVVVETLDPSRLAAQLGLEQALGRALSMAHRLQPVR